MRRAIVIALVLAVLGAAAWTVLRWERAPFGMPPADPWHAVPPGAAAIIEARDAPLAWDRFIHASLLWRRWEGLPGPARLARLMARAQRMMDADARLRDDLRGTLLIAVARAGRAGAQPIAIGTCASCAHDGPMGAFLGLRPDRWPSLAEAGAVACDGDTALAGWHAACRRGLWMLSPSAFLIDEALLQLDGGEPITSDPLLAQARATLAPDADARVAIRTERLVNLLSDAWEPAALERLGIPSGWLALDARAQADALLLSGLLAPDGDHALVRSLHAQGEGEWDIARALPAGVAAFESRAVQQADAALEQARALDARTRATEAFADWMLGPVGIARGLRPDRTWLVATTPDPERAAAALQEPCAERPCDTLNHRGIRITRQPAVMAHELLLGRAARLPQQPWWAMLGDHAVMSDDPAAVRASIDAWIDGGSLAEDPAARAMLRRLSSRSGLTWWCDPARGAELLLRGLRTAQADRWLAVLRRHAGISLQCAPAPNGWLHTSITLLAESAGPSAASDGKAAALWSFAPDAPLRGLPWVVVNHTNGTRELLVQDSLNRIHLIGASGKALWTRALDGPIAGAVHQVDRFRNGKLQLLLATATTLHLIDRNGNDVGAPRKLPGRLAAPIAVIDYDGRREYRIVAPLEDGRLLNLDLDWAPVQGWSEPKLPAQAIASARHLRIGNKDYLLVAQRDGAVRLLDRKGSDRERSPARLDGVKLVLAVEPGQRLLGTRIIWLDAELRPHATLLDGTDASAALEGEWADLDGDGRPEHIAAAAAAPHRRAPIVLRLPRPAGGQAEAPWPSGSDPPWRFEPCSVCPAELRPSICADLDTDGRPETIVVSSASLEVIQGRD